MPRLLLLLAIIAVIYILLQRARAVPPHKRRAEYIKLGLGVAVVVVIGLTLTGRMHWVGAALTGLLVAARQTLPTLLRLFPMLASLRAQGASASQGQTSTVSTAILRMQLDHDSGQLRGEVLKGSFQGWLLDEMDRSQLDALMAYCQHEDADSVQLLDTYLAQRFPGSTAGESNQQGSDSSSSGMSRAEALAVLGLDEGASHEDIISAHRKLMQKLHPDRGGNNYLAAKVNQAKDLLTG